MKHCKINPTLARHYQHELKRAVRRNFSTDRLMLHTVKSLKVQIFGHREFQHGCSDCIANIPTWANLFNKHGSIRQCKRLPLGAGLPRPCACALPGARGAPPRRRPVRLMENWSQKRYSRVPGAEGSEARRMKPAGVPNTEAWLQKFMGPLYMYSKIFPEARTL